MRLLRTSFLVTASVLLSIAAACESEPQKKISGEEACFELGRDCHGLARSGPLEDCHNIGHDGDPEVCSAEYERCAALCAEARANQPDGEPHPSEPPIESGAPDADPPPDAEVDASPMEAGQLLDVDAPPMEAGQLPEAEPPVDAPEPPLPPAPTWENGNELCRLLSNLCHGLADSGPLEECHTLGHDGNASACLAESDCVAQCWEVCARNPACAEKYD